MASAMSYDAPAVLSTVPARNYNEEWFDTNSNFLATCFTATYNGESVKYLLTLKNLPSSVNKKVQVWFKTYMTGVLKCTECWNKISKMLLVCAQGGCPIANIKGDLPIARTLRELAKEIHSGKTLNDYTPVVIREQDISQSGGFFHYAFEYTNTTPATVPNSVDKMLHYYFATNTISQLVKFLPLKFEMNVLQKTLESSYLLRKEHWTPAINYILKCQKFFAVNSADVPFGTLSLENQINMIVQSLLFGNINGKIVSELQIAINNFIDFFEKAHNFDALIVLMNSRCNPETYMVSGLQAKMEMHNVIGNYITLAWNAIPIGRDLTDLDLAVFWQSKAITFSNKKVEGVGELKFDANAPGVTQEKAASECISFNDCFSGTVTVQITNYNGGGRGSTSYELTVVNNGVSTIIEGSVLANQGATATHIVNISKFVAPEITLSESDANKLSTQLSKFNTLTGGLTCNVLTTTSNGVEVILINNTSKKPVGKQTFSELLKVSKTANIPATVAPSPVAPARTPARTPAPVAPASALPISKCTVCMDSDASRIVAPCGHKCMCITCCDQIVHSTNQCPICRETIESTIGTIYDVGIQDEPLHASITSASITSVSIPRALSSPVAPVARSSFLQRVVPTQPQLTNLTRQGVFEYLQKYGGNNCKLFLNPREHNLALAVNVATNNGQSIFKNSESSKSNIVVYTSYGQLPDQLHGDMTLGTAVWTEKMCPSSKLEISHLCNVNGELFMVVKSAVFPQNVPEFPYSAGLSATDLNSDCHEFKKVYTALTTETFPKNLDANDGVPLVGVVLLKTHRYIIELNGKSYSISG